MDVPPEIIAEILKVLDWFSLLKIRQTCKHINAVSRTLEVWVGQYHQYAAENVTVPRLEEPLMSHSAEELERWVLVRRSVDEGWKRDTGHTRYRQIQQYGLGGFCIVPGGRWLLVGDRHCGAVTVYDMDAPVPTGILLILPDIHKQPIGHIAVEIDTRSSNFSFNIALSPFFRYDVPMIIIPMWRVTLTGHKAEAQLIAEPLRSFETRADDNQISSIALFRNLFARQTHRHGLSYIEVFDWKKSTSSVHHKAVIYANVDIECFRLLPNNRLVIFSATQIRVYSLDIMRVDGAASIEILGIVPPIWSLPKVDTRTTHVTLSQGLFNKLGSHFNFVTKYGVQSLVIPSDEDQEPRLIDIQEFDHPVLSNSAVGLEKAFVLHFKFPLFLSFDWGQREVGSTDLWPPGSCGIAVSDDRSVTFSEARLLEFDEETGRIVASSEDGVQIFDTALYI